MFQAPPVFVKPGDSPANFVRVFQSAAHWLSTEKEGALPVFSAGRKQA